MELAKYRSERCWRLVPNDATSQSLVESLPLARSSTMKLEQVDVQTHYMVEAQIYNRQFHTRSVNLNKILELPHMTTRRRSRMPF